MNLWIQIASVSVAFLILCANLYYVAKFRQSVDIQRKTSQGQLLLNISNQFFYNEPHKEIIRRLDEGGRLRKGPNVAHGFSDADLDDHIGMLDTLGTFVKVGILDEGLVWALFSHYVDSAYNSSEIAGYVKSAQEIDPTYFEDFVWLYQKLGQHKR